MNAAFWSNYAKPGRDQPVSTETPRARVFISCGQSKQSDEVQTASAISDRLRELGFDPYIAVAEQTLRGLRENIFEQLRKSEYFLFVDFKRELLVDSEFCRGSLFSHQELAIASLLDIEVAAFQEKGVKPTDGLMQFLQTNTIQFIDKNLLPNAVADIVRQRGWNPSWRNELVLEAPQFVDNVRTYNVSGFAGLGKFFHVNVRNRHREKLALNCCVYLESAIKRPVLNIPLKTIEFKWAGTRLPSVGIAAGTTRLFDAFHILYAEPHIVLFDVHTDSTEYIPLACPMTSPRGLHFLQVRKSCYMHMKDTLLAMLDRRLQQSQSGFRPTRAS
jgi:hypothetical protein